jgi:hypothetical protein
VLRWYYLVSVTVVAVPVVGLVSWLVHDSGLSSIRLQPGHLI